MPSNRIANSKIQIYAKKSLAKWLKALESVPTLKKAIPRNNQGTVAPLSVAVTVCSLKRMTQLNSEYRGKAKPTDVLSFPSDPFYWNQGVLGDLVLCGPVLVAQAKDHRHAWKKEADVLMIHGLLHLLGYDHELGKKQANQMARLEKKLLEQSRSRGMGLIARSGEIG